MVGADTWERIREQLQWRPRVASHEEVERARAWFKDKIEAGKAEVAPVSELLAAYAASERRRVWEEAAKICQSATRHKYDKFNDVERGWNNALEDAAKVLRARAEESR